MNRLVVSFVGLLACLAACQAMPEQEFPFGRIVNGEPTTIEAHPYQVSIQTIKGGHFCGGSLIDSQTVVTAAHCLQKNSPNELQVRMGSTDRNEGGELVTVAAFKFHEGYTKKEKANDVAVIRLSSPVRQSAKVRYIPLAKTTPPSGTQAVVTGWGTTCFFWCSSTITLQQVKVDLVSLADCGSSTYSYGQDKILETMVCAYTETKDACQGDSGGPLVANGELIGVVSWGQSCAKANYPGVYADVASLRTWILSTAANL
ncbi:trypsin-like [Drosophila hydei]|uniref:Trypsin-like n=1 Tax=Drosophila hydei TaxID=7224 RepID=A0A6J1LFN6_DROHY|nr:trypsin-like [Drosophila hydei]